VSIKGLSNGERTPDPRFQGKARKNGEFQLLHLSVRNDSCIRRKTSPSYGVSHTGKYKTVAEIHKENQA
jgi:hypothetical protein